MHRPYSDVPDCPFTAKDTGSCTAATVLQPPLPWSSLCVLGICEESSQCLQTGTQFGLACSFLRRDPSHAEEVCPPSFFSAGATKLTSKSSMCNGIWGEQALQTSSRRRGPHCSPGHPEDIRKHRGFQNLACGIHVDAIAEVLT